MTTTDLTKLVKIRTTLLKQDPDINPHTAERFEVCVGFDLAMTDELVILANVLKQVLQRLEALEENQGPTLTKCAGNHADEA